MPAQKHFLILVPAHNEASVISHTLERIEKVNYPPELIQVVVVADNCNDDTAKVVRAMGVKCLERSEPERPGKGYALSWAVDKILPVYSFDAMVVIDADTYMNDNFLLVMNTLLIEGAEAIQAYSQVRHPEHSSMESLAFLGFALNRNLRYKGRSRLGLQANLMGTGMCFSRSIVERFGWPAVSMVEDLEFTMFLKLHGIRVVFAPDAKVSVKLHEDVGKSRGQRLRWDVGKFQVRNIYLSRLFRSFLRTREISYLDAMMELILPPFALLFLAVWILFIPYFLLDFHGFNGPFYLWVAAIFSMAVYVLMGLISARADQRVYKSLVYAPFFVIWRAWIIIMEYVKRAPRSGW